MKRIVRRVMSFVLVAVTASLMTGCAAFSWIGLDLFPSSNSSYAQTVPGLVSYGMDNFWMTVSPTKLGNALVDDGNCTMTSVEFLGWASNNYYEDPKPLFSKFDSFLSAMRNRNIWVFVSICNDNKGSGKHGDNGKGLDQYKPQLMSVVAYLKSKGSKGLIVQPVAETKTATGRWMEQYCVQQLAGYKLCWNGGGSKPAGWWTFAIHPGSLSNKGLPGGITITDHSNALIALSTNEVPFVTMNIGHTIYGNADPVVLEAYVKEVLKTNDRGFGYYGFAHKEIDYNGLKAIGKAVRAVR